MTRKDVLLWCFENILNHNNNYTRDEVINIIGGVYYEELHYMGFLSEWYNWIKDCHCVYLSWIGKAYCEELFT